MYMQYNLYKPNSKNTGCVFSFKILQKGKDGKPAAPTFLIECLKQSKWDAAKKTGSFSENSGNPEKNIFVKLGEVEIGGFLNAIEKYEEFSAFHTYNEDQTTIMFSPYTKQNGTKAFSFTITKNKTLKFGIGMELSEARTLKSLMELFLIKFFNYEKA
jgi:hypothetical protein